jgi:two-component system, sensor histidine kinase ChiS
VLAGAVGPGWAQSASLRFRTLSVEDGLSQSTVRAIFQDTHGFMWFGTDDGLNRYDGYTFTIYKHDPENPASLSDNSINTIYQDSFGDLWFGTASGLDRFQPLTETFEHYQYYRNKPGSLRGTPSPPSPKTSRPTCGWRPPTAGQPL